jgi:hypothetical protein
MLHVRAVSPADRTGQLMETLAALPGVQNLVVLAKGARRPEGDAVAFEVHDGGANPVFRVLRAQRAIWRRAPRSGGAT